MLFDISNLKRNPDVFSKYLEIKGETTFTNEELKVMFPSRFIKKELAFINNDFIRVIGIYSILDNNNNYTVIRTPIYHEIQYSSLEYIIVDDVEYVLVTVLKDTVFLINNNLVVSDKFVYDVFDEFFSNGNIPWYLNYEDVARLFEDGVKFANVKIGNDPFIFELLTSIIARVSSDKTKKYRTNTDGNLAFVGLNDIIYGFNNTGASLIGGYFKDGIVNSIVRKEEESTELVKILRV